MSDVSYFDDSVVLGQAFSLRSYETVRKQVLNARSGNEIVDDEGEIYAYEISLNHPLTAIYGFTCYVVKFRFSRVSILHNKRQEELLRQLCVKLHNEIENNNGYYDIRIPTHIVDLLKAFNSTFCSYEMCGGTVEEIMVGEIPPYTINSSLKLFFADKDYVSINRHEMEQQAYNSFESYQGQYHISNTTSDRAGEIYRRWVANYLDNFSENTVMICEYNNKLIGYCMIAENEIAIDAVLSSVDSTYRRLGAYKAMIYSLITYAKDSNKIFVTSTQFDNYIVQGTWNSLGLRPFSSIYNIHIDRTRICCSSDLND